MTRKAVLISIRPEWCARIASGKKTIEVRKTSPKLETPFKCYIYCTKDPGNKGSATHFFESDEGTFWSAGKTFAAFLSGTVIGEFVCDSIQTLFFDSDVRYGIDHPNDYGKKIMERSCLTLWEIQDYLEGKDGYTYHISNLQIYDRPKVLSDFKTYNTRVVIENGFPMPTHEIKRPPQSWCYVEKQTGAV